MRRILGIVLACLVLSGCGGGGDSESTPSNFAGTWVKDSSMARTEITLNTIDNTNYTGTFTFYNYNPYYLTITTDGKPLTVKVDIEGAVDPNYGVQLHPVLWSANPTYIDNLHINTTSYRVSTSGFVLDINSDDLEIVTNPNLPAPQLKYDRLSYNLAFWVYNKSVFNSVYNSADWDYVTWWDELYR